MGRRLMCAFHSRVASRCLSGFITRQRATKRGLAPFFMRQKRPPFSLQMSLATPNPFEGNHTCKYLHSLPPDNPAVLTS